MGKVKEYYYEMNILDLNEDIMGKIKHKLFLKQLIKHRQDNFYKVFKTSLKEWNKYENPGVLFCVELARQFRMRGANLLFGLALDGDARRLAPVLVGLFFDFAC